MHAQQTRVRKGGLIGDPKFTQQQKTKCATCRSHSHSRSAYVNIYIYHTRLLTRAMRTNDTRSRARASMQPLVKCVYTAEWRADAPPSSHSCWKKLWGCCWMRPAHSPFNRRLVGWCVCVSYVFRIQRFERFRKRIPCDFLRVLNLVFSVPYKL